MVDMKMVNFYQQNLHKFVEVLKVDEKILSELITKDKEYHLK